MASAATAHTSGTVRVLLYQDAGGDRLWWVAHCLDYDIAAPAHDPRAALHELARMLDVQADTAKAHGLEPFSTCPRAEPSLWERWEKGVEVARGEAGNFEARAA